MRSLYVTRRRIADVLWNAATPATRVRWAHLFVLTVHYFGRDDNKTFALVGERWWKLEYHWSSYVHQSSDWDAEVISAIQLDSVTEVAPPTGVVYSHSEEWGSDEPVDVHSKAVGGYIGCTDDPNLFP